MLINKIAAANKDTTTCTVVFSPGGKAYSYRVHRSLGVVKGDLVTVEANNEFKVVKVAAVHAESQIPLDAPKLGSSFVYSKIDQLEVTLTKTAEAIALANLEGTNK